MKFIHFLAFMLALNFSSEMFAQVSLGKSELGITIGYNNGLLKDLNFSPLNYRQRGLAFSLDYTSHKRKNGDLWQIHLGFSPNTIHTDASENFSSDFLTANIRVDYLKKLSNDKSNFLKYLGGQFSSHNNFIFYDGTESFSYFFAHGFGLKGQIDWQLKNSRSIQSSLSIPLVNWVVRPPYNGFNKTTVANETRPFRLLTEEGKVTSINNYIAFDWNVQYRFAMSDRFDFALKYGLHYQHYRDVHALTQLENQFAVIAILKF